MELENTDFIKNALVPLAKKHSIGKDEAWEIFKNDIQNNSIDIRSSELRGRVNKWWKKNKDGFHTMGLGVLNKTSSPSKLPNDTYMQVCCLMLAEDAFSAKSLIERMKTSVEQEIEIKKEISSWMKFWQKVARLTESITAFFKRLVPKDR